MSVAQKMLSREDIVKIPQFVVEGHSPSNYGTTPNSPNFAAAGQNAMITQSNEPEFIDNDFAGSYDRQGIIKVREKNTATFKGRFLPADLGLLRWAMNIPDAAGSPQESRTWMESYNNSAGTEIFRVYKGCKPITSTLTITHNNAVELEIQFEAHTFLEGTAHGLAGTPVFAEEQDGTPLVMKDVGQFTYAGVNTAFMSATITTTFAQRRQDSNGSETVVYIEPSQRRVTGNFSVYKTGQTLNEDARLGKQVAADLVLQDKTGTGTKASARVPASGANYLNLVADIAGTYGNSLSLTVRDASATKVEVHRGKDIVITRASGDTIADLVSAVNADAEASALVTAAAEGTGTTAAENIAKTQFTGGAEVEGIRIALPRFRWLPSAEPMKENSEATMEVKNFEADEIAFSAA